MSIRKPYLPTFDMNLSDIHQKYNKQVNALPTKHKRRLSFIGTDIEFNLSSKHGLEIVNEASKTTFYQLRLLIKLLDLKTKKDIKRLKMLCGALLITEHWRGGFHSFHEVGVTIAAVINAHFYKRKKP